MQRMMTLQELLAWLETHKGSGRWQEVATASGVEYNTIARIARGYMKTPSVVIVERIVAGIRATDKPARKAKAAA